MCKGPEVRKHLMHLRNLKKANRSVGTHLETRLQRVQVVQDLGSQVKGFGFYPQSIGKSLKGFNKDMIRFVLLKIPLLLCGE